MRFLRATVRSGLFWSTQQFKLRLLPYTLVTLVQTDKSKYKAGDLVQFRVVTLKSDLTAMEEVVDQIFITTPGGTRLAQFDKVATRSGIIQKKFQLTEEPPLGRWTIHVKRRDRIVRQPFEVEEYVLPRFEVTITGPKYITRGANTVTLKVCATYTFGKPVSGAAMKLLVSRPSTFFSRRRGASGSEEKPPSNVTFAEETDKNGCVEIDVVLAKIGLGSAPTRRVHASRIMAEANVTESGTDILQQADITIPIQNRRVRIEMYRAAGYGFIKPKLPYFGYVSIKDADNEPLAKERIPGLLHFLLQRQERVGSSTTSHNIPVSYHRSCSVNRVFRHSGQG
ncbi:ovostatin-like [Pollicipes pollicipes]|uniref:ovostatin-like n=1 Tax=Pollicipes pollicipes TaxID=41117 RepID=UPI0018855D5F|nr:ovostatin-like [Pollicipes pollicipes]